MQLWDQIVPTMSVPVPLSVPRSKICPQSNKGLFFKIVVLGNAITFDWNKEILQAKNNNNNKKDRIYCYNAGK